MGHRRGWGLWMPTTHLSNRFQPPKGYIPSSFSPEIMTTFGRDALKNDTEKQLWIIKVPDGVSTQKIALLEAEPLGRSQT